MNLVLSRNFWFVVDIVIPLIDVVQTSKGKEQQAEIE